MPRKKPTIEEMVLGIDTDGLLNKRDQILREIDRSSCEMIDCSAEIELLAQTIEKLKKEDK